MLAYLAASCPRCLDCHRERSDDSTMTETAGSWICVGCIQKTAVDLKRKVWALKEFVSLMR